MLKPISRVAIGWIAFIGSGCLVFSMTISGELDSTLKGLLFGLFGLASVVLPRVEKLFKRADSAVVRLHSLELSSNCALDVLYNSILGGLLGISLTFIFM
jgi:hypothetical protein